MPGQHEVRIIVGFTSVPLLVQSLKTNIHLNRPYYTEITNRNQYLLHIGYYEWTPQRTLAERAAEDAAVGARTAQIRRGIERFLLYGKSVHTTEWLLRIVFACWNTPIVWTLW